MKRILNDWLRNYSNIVSRKIYKKRVNEFLAYYNVNDLEDFQVLTHEKIVYWAYRLHKWGYTKVSCKVRISILSSFFKYLVKMKLLKFNPVNSKSQELKDVLKGIKTKNSAFG